MIDVLHFPKESKSMVKIRPKSSRSKIADCTPYYRKLQYLVKWLGYPVTDNKWLSAQDMSDAREYIIEFHERYPAKPSPQNLHREQRLRDKKAWRRFTTTQNLSCQKKKNFFFFPPLRRPSFIRKGDIVMDCDQNRPYARSC